MKDFLSLFSVWLGLSVGNLIYFYFEGGEIFSRIYFQGFALFVVWICLKVSNMTIVKKDLL